jgi:4-hydroxy-2-oxoglutarate aldolase
MGDMRRLEGVLPAVPTPFRGDAPAPELLERLIAALVPTGLAGFLVLGSNGEAFSLTDAEREDVLRAARRVIPKSQFFLAGCGAESTHVALARVAQAADCGADAALVLTPHYLRAWMSAEGYFRHFAGLADAAPLPIYLYNIPQFTGVTLDVDTVARLSAHPNIHGMKDSSGNVTYLTQVVAAAGRNFALLAGSDKVLASALLMGAAGGILALANVAPRECVQLYDLCRAGRWDEAARLQSRLLPMGTAVTTRFGVPGLKAGLRLLGLDAGEPRLPLLPLADVEVAEVESVFRAGGLLA